MARTLADRRREEAAAAEAARKEAVAEDSSASDRTEIASESETDEHAVQETPPIPQPHQDQAERDHRARVLAVFTAAANGRDVLMKVEQVWQGKKTTDSAAARTHSPSTPVLPPTGLFPLPALHSPLNSQIKRGRGTKKSGLSQEYILSSDKENHSPPQAAVTAFKKPAIPNSLSRKASNSTVATRASVKRTISTDPAPAQKPQEPKKLRLKLSNQPDIENTPTSAANPNAESLIVKLRVPTSFLEALATNSGSNTQPTNKSPALPPVMSRRRPSPPASAPPPKLPLPRLRALSPLSLVPELPFPPLDINNRSHVDEFIWGVYLTAENIEDDQKEEPAKPIAEIIQILDDEKPIFEKGQGKSGVGVGERYDFRLVREHGNKWAYKAARQIAASKPGLATAEITRIVREVAGSQLSLLTGGTGESRGTPESGEDQMEDN